MTDRKLVHIVDDEEAVRRSIGYMLRVAGYAFESWPSGAAFLQDSDHVEEGCILLDVRMADMDGLQVQEALTERGVTMPVVIMTGHGDISTAVRAMKAGAIDFIEKPFDKAGLLTALNAAFAHIDAAGGAVPRTLQAEQILDGLTPRERDVLEGLVKGLPNKTIAYDLGISARTVEVHRANLMTKLNVRSLSDALRIAFSAGLGA
ncbi:MAG TPA: response regulator [Sphingobium sp.]|uniref:response regulator transcription factor n=1 Tax=Sphingobium sp. TaxID=1912891 RepID=UPI002ED4A704